MHAGIQFYLAERVFILTHILLQDGEESLCLLGTDVNALEVYDLDLSFALLLQSAEYQEEVPDIDPDLHTVGIVLAVGRSVNQLNVWLHWHVHSVPV